MTRVFADSFYFLALVNNRDNAIAWAKRVSAINDLHLITTNWVLAEVANGLARPPARAVIVRLFELLHRNANVEILKDSDDLFTKGFELFSARLDKAWSLTDCTSFVVM